MSKALVAVAVAVALAALTATRAVAAEALDPSLYAYHERTGGSLPSQIALRDSDERMVRFAEIQRGLPLILVPAYFRCANLCGVVRASLLQALRTSGLAPGRDYSLAVFSIDPAESGDDARAAKGHDLAAFGSANESADWHYLTGSVTAVEAVTDAVGFRDRRDPQTGQFIHPAGIVFVSPRGVVSSYLLGVGYTAAAVRSAVQRASAGRLTAIGAPLLLICFHFDPTTGRYSLEVMKVVRLGAVLTVLTLAGMLLLLFRRHEARS